jgi:hypothetical protein
MRWANSHLDSYLILLSRQGKVVSLPSPVTIRCHEAN